MFTSNTYFFLGGIIIYGVCWLTTDKTSFILAHFNATEYILFTLLSVLGAVGFVFKALAL